jgi:hypothetical protein
MVRPASPPEPRPVHDRRRQRGLQPVQVPLPQVAHHGCQGQRAHGRGGHRGAAELQGDQLAAHRELRLEPGQRGALRAVVSGPDHPELYCHEAQQVLIVI